MKRLGPVLQFVGNDQDQWRVSALWVQDSADAPPGFAAGGRPVQTAQAPVPGLPCTAWRFEFEVAQGAVAQAVDYRVGDEQHSFHVPARGQMPAMAYASCNGFSDPRAMKSIRAPNALWARLGRLHAQQDKVDSQTYGPLHLLLMGGDQVYSDAMWAVLPELKAWCDKPWRKRVNAPFTATLRSKLETYFSRLYLERWSQPEVAAALATLPTVMMWDDHDIMDGWGSHPAEQHNCPVFQGIFQVASAAFALFQRQMLGAPRPAALPGQMHHNSAWRVGDLGLLALDMRSERRPRMGEFSDAAGGVLQPEQVLSPQSWSAVYQWLAAQEAAGDMKHLFVMSSIPVLHPSFELLETLLGWLPGQQEMEDDLRDHWTSPPHKAERLRLIHRLLQASAKGTRVTLLSGDVHVAALGVIESVRDPGAGGSRVINQLTSSGIVHPPSSGVELFFLEHACQKVEVIDRGISGTMHEFPTSSRRVMGSRNFLTLQPDRAAAGARYWANWWLEGEPHPYTKVIHPA